MSDTFIEVDYVNRFKYKKVCSGDIFLSERAKDGCVVAVLTDGLGSGQQANVCSSLTATMALEYMRAETGLRRAATMIMDALPLCPERHISYSTFTMIHADPMGKVRIIEYENPPAQLLRGTEVIPIERTPYTLPRWGKRKMSYATFQMQRGDRLYFCSDGVTQAGLGEPNTPFGQGLECVVQALQARISGAPSIDAHQLCREVVDHATHLDGGRAGDDTTAAMLYYRDPRKVQILTGCPFHREDDGAFANLLLAPNVKTIVAGGSTADLVARCLGRPIETALPKRMSSIPPTSTIPGITLVTEGCITLSRVIELLDAPTLTLEEDAATQMVDLLLGSDQIHIDVGTAINPAHQDPNLPVALDIRRNIVRELSTLLTTKYFKDVTVAYH